MELSNLHITPNGIQPEQEIRLVVLLEVQIELGRIEDVDIRKFSRMVIDDMIQNEKAIE